MDLSRIVAAHEGGHVIGNMLGDRRVTRASIVPDLARGILGHVEHTTLRGDVGPKRVAAIWAGDSPELRRRIAQYVADRIRACLAGPAAEDHFLDRGMTVDPNHVIDYSTALSYLRATGAPDARAALQRAYADARAFVEAHQQHLDALAEALLVHRELDLSGIRRALEALPPIRWAPGRGTG
jgi:hypothetical protein